MSEKNLSELRIKEYFDRFLDLEYSEERDIVSTSITLKKFDKGLFFLFNKYTSPVKKKKNNKEYIERKISISEIWKMMLEHQINNYISKEEFTISIKYLNFKIFGKMQLNNFDFDGFCRFLIFISVFMFYKQNLGKIYKLLGSFLEDFLIYIHIHTKNKDIKNALYFERTIVSDEIYRMNEILEKNPKLEVPKVNYIKDLYIFT